MLESNISLISNQNKDNNCNISSGKYEMTMGWSC